MSRRLVAKIDANQTEIVDALRRCGAGIVHVHTLHVGCGDILAGFRGQNYLLEIKDGLLAPSRRLLTPLEREFHDTWPGQVAVVESIEDALRTIGAI